MSAIFPAAGASASPALCCALRRAQRLAQTRLEARYAEADLSFTQGTTLTLLRAHGTLSTRELATHLGLRPVGAARIAEGLVSRGLIEKDPRSTPSHPLFVLTIAGMTTMDQVAAEIERRRRHLRDGLTDSELDALVALLGKFSDAIDPTLQPAHAPKEA